MALDTWQPKIVSKIEAPLALDRLEEYWRIWCDVGRARWLGANGAYWTSRFGTEKIIALTKKQERSNSIDTDFR